MYMNKISIIVPCYNEEEVLKIFYEKITEISAKVNAEFEYLFIDDGSFIKNFICKFHILITIITCKFKKFIH